MYQGDNGRRYRAELRKREVCWSEVDRTTLRRPEFLEQETPMYSWWD